MTDDRQYDYLTIRLKTIRLFYEETVWRLYPAFN